jgi:threonine aldolase
MGGGMRQAGFLAAAGIYALDNHIDRLNIDNQNARILGEVLEEMSYVTDVRPVQSNILIFDIDDRRTVAEFLQILEEQCIKAVQFGPKSVRFTMHLDVSDNMVGRVIEVLRKIN